MPLIKGTSPEAFSQNIEELVRSGRPVDQAAAIAYKYARGEDSAAGILYRAGGAVLLLLRSADAGDYPLHWCFPGGGIEEGETSEQAAIRESQEEIGYTPTDPLSMLDYDSGFTTYALTLPSPFGPVLNHEHLGYVWAPLDALPTPLHPGVAATLARLPAVTVGMDAREYDSNGWYEIKANPISKVGVFPYSGRQLGLTGDDAGRIFQVLRPPEELSAPECVESFKLLPWIDDHTMLGPVAQEMSDKALAAERKGVQGVIGEDVFYKEGTLFANIKAFSSTLAALIEAGKRELSAGYRCTYDLASGVWNGLPYDAIQRNIRGNHLALVKEGRMGSDVAVMDHFTFTFDAKEIQMPDPVQTPEGGAAPVDLAAVVKQLEAIAPQVQQLMSFMEKLKPLEEAEHGEALDKGVPPVPGAPAADAVAEAAADKAVPPAATGMDASEMERAMLGRIAKRDTLAAQISKHVGTFDHAAMTLDDVVHYGCEKLGIKADKGHEGAMLAGFLQAKPAAVPSATVSGMDAAHTGGAANFVTKHLTPKEG